MRERLNDLHTTIPGTVGLVFVVLASAYDAILSGYEYLRSIGIRIELTESSLMKIAVAAVCIGLILSYGRKSAEKGGDR